MELSDQVNEPVAQVAVRVKVVGEQTIKLAGELTIGAFGVGLISSETGGELWSEVQPFEVQFAEIE